MFLRVFVALVVLPLLASAAAPPTEDEIFARYAEIETRSSQYKGTFGEAERKRLFDRVANDPVASLDAVDKYDPQGIVGFCFGRAMAAHLYARRAGLNYGSVAKLFIVGDLRSGKDPEWRFHVTTIVKGHEGKWYAIDPIMTPPMAPGGPLPVEEWIRIVKGVWDKDDKANLYVTEAGIVFPDITADADGKSGDKIIELGFEPSKRAGFQSVKLGKYNAYTVTRDAAVEYFIGNSIIDPEGRFKFLGIQIPSLVKLGLPPDVDYHGYFVDSIDEVYQTPVAQALSMQRTRSCPTGIGELAAPMNTRRSLYSPRIFGR